MSETSSSPYLTAEQVKLVINMSLLAAVCSPLKHQHETIQELLNGFSDEQLWCLKHHIKHIYANAVSPHLVINLIY